MKLTQRRSWDNLENVAAQDCALAVRPIRPVQHGATVEMPAATNQGQALADFLRLALPEFDGRIRPHDPSPVGGVEVDRTIEGSAPLDHAGVIVGMGNCDG